MSIPPLTYAWNEEAVARFAEAVGAAGTHVAFRGALFAAARAARTAHTLPDPQPIR
jgi:hypothetical protein